MSVRCGRCGTEAADGARFCSSCGAALDAPAARERKLATIVFADLVGSTELVMGIDPEEVRLVFDPFFELARATFEEHGGRLEKFIGDAAVAVFGVPQVHGDDPDRAIAAALLLAERLPQVSKGLQVRVGIETGEVLVDVGGADLQVTGEATHAAARLQQAAAPGEVLVGARAAAGSRRAVLGEAQSIPAKGFDEPLTALPAVGVRTATEGTRTPFLGRGEELERLRIAYLRTVRERRPTLALIVGEAGLGKTRLATELLEALGRLDPAPEVLLGRNPPYGNGIAFWALGEILRGAARVGSDAGQAEIHNGLESRLSAVDPERRADAARTLVATATGEGDAVATMGGALRLAWRRLLAGIATEGPLVIAIDDAHWADEEFLGLIEDSARSLNDLPVLFLCTARPSLLKDRPEFAKDGLRLELDPLDDDATLELAATLLPNGDATLAGEIAATSAGNPFFAEEIAHSLDGGGDAAVALPDTVQTAIASRLDVLPPSAKTVLQRAAILGDRFSVQSLAGLLGADPEPELATLCARSLVRDRSEEEPGLFSFQHQLIRDVAYESLTRSERTALHEQAAAGIGADAVDRHPELAEVIAFHLVQAADLQPDAERSRAAFDAAREASARALRRGALARAHDLLAEASRFAPDTEEAVRALRDGAEIALRRVRGDIAFGMLRRAGEVAEAAGDSALAAANYAHALEMPTRMGGVSGTFAEADIAELLDRCHELAPDPEPATQAQLKLDEAWMAWRFGREEEMAAPALEGLKLARATGSVRLLSSALDAVSAASWRRGRFRETAEYNRERLRVLEQTDLSGFLVFERQDAFQMLTEALVRCGELRESVENDAVISAELIRTAPQIAYVKSLLPLLMLGEWDEAVERGAGVRQRWEEEGRPPFTPFGSEIAAVGSIHGFRGDELAAEDWFRVAEAVVGGSTPQLSGVVMRRADVALHQGDAASALAMVDGVDPGFWWTDWHLVKLAEVLAVAGSPRAQAAIETAERREHDDPYATGTLARARGIMRNDPAELRAGVDTFDRHGYAFEAARTRWLLGGDDREAGERALVGLGATLPPS
jgi:class 3 adenylate cyclase